MDPVGQNNVHPNCGPPLSLHPTAAKPLSRHAPYPLPSAASRPRLTLFHSSRCRDASSDHLNLKLTTSEQPQSLQRLARCHAPIYLLVCLLHKARLPLSAQSLRPPLTLSHPPFSIQSVGKANLPLTAPSPLGASASFIWVTGLISQLAPHFHPPLCSQGAPIKTQPGKAPCGSCPFRVNPEPPPWSVKSSACGPSALHMCSLLSPCASNLTPTSPDSAPATRASGSSYKALAVPSVGGFTLALPPDIWSLSNRGELGLVFLSQIHYQG